MNGYLTAGPGVVGNADFNGPSRNEARQLSKPAGSFGMEMSGVVQIDAGNIRKSPARGIFRLCLGILLQSQSQDFIAAFGGGESISWNLKRWC